MKAFSIVLFISLVALYISVVPNKGCNEITTPKNVTDCKIATIRTGYHACCFENYYVGIKSNPSCVEITKDDYNNLDEYKKKKESQMGIHTNYTFVCKGSISNYSALLLLSLIFLLL